MVGTLGCFDDIHQVGYIEYKSKYSVLSAEESETKQNHALLNQQMMPSKKFGLKRSKTSRSDFQQYSFSEVDAATDYFAPANKLGEGGFGPVYKVKDSIL